MSKNASGDHSGRVINEELLRGVADIAPTFFGGG